MNWDIFSWQKKDWETLLDNSNNKITIIYGKDFDSPYNIFHVFKRHLEENNNKVLYIEKNDPHITTPLFPFSTTVSEFSSNSSIDGSIISSIVKDVTFSETLATIILNIIKRKPDKNILIDEKSNELLIQIQKYIKGKPAVFIFQNYSFFDDLSKELTNLMISDYLNDKYPFLSSAKFYFLCSESENQKSYHIIETKEHSNIHLSNPTINNMTEIIAEISPSTNLTHDERTKLFTICGGSLVALQILLTYSREIQNKNYNVEYSDDIIEVIIKKRIDEISVNFAAIEKTLTTAAAIGDPFSIQLLQWIIKLSDKSFREVMSKSRDELFVEYDSINGKFTYPILWEYFRKAEYLQDKADFFNSIAKGIYFFNPRDYWKRAMFLELAGNQFEACEIYYFAFYTLYSDTHKRPDDCIKKISLLSDKCGLTSFWKAQLKFYDHYEKLEYEQALLSFDFCNIFLTQRLHLFKEYLVALCVYKTGDEQQLKENALVSLEMTVKESKDIEEGFWCDCLSTLISFYVNLNGQTEDTCKYFKELEYYYSKRQDKNYAQVGLHILNRKSASVFSVERAVLRTQESVIFFRNNIYPTQYLMSLNNHGANLMLLGEFVEAENCFLEALEFIKNYHVRENIIIYLMNNLLVCQIQKESVNHNLFVNFTNIIDRYTDYGWGIIPIINCAIFTALSNNLDHATDLLIKAKTINEKLNDSYYDYYINANMAAIQYLRGDRYNASKTLIEKCSIPPLLSKATEKQYLKQRTKEWAAAMENFNVKDVWEFFNLLIKKVGGNQWKFISRGFLCSDIQFWAET